jgi:hypothetical protein
LGAKERGIQMLTEIFAKRYATVPTWQTFGEPERRLLVQAFRIVSEHLFPYWIDGKERTDAKATWRSMHDRLSMELGLQELSPRGFWRNTTLAGNPHSYWQELAWINVCTTFVCAPYDATIPVDRFVKERLSFVEIAFRDRENAVAALNASLPQRIAKAELDAKAPLPYRGIRVQVPGNPGDAVRNVNARVNQEFRALVNELNVRFQEAGVNLNYHNGFIQMADDALVEVQIETPFWSLVIDPKWKNVDTDMKEAIDRRDTGQRDPALYAARALESTIKIISNEKGWTRGVEKGASQYIDNLVPERNGSRFIEVWEMEALKKFFSSVRNELGHGPGDQPMPELTPQQTNWAIESAMSWTKSLVRRM